MKALRFLTILLTTFSLFSVQVVVSTPAYAGDTEEFFSGGAGAKVGLDGKEKTGDEEGGMNMNMIVLFAIVFSAPLYVVSCFDRIDTWLFVATSAIYVAAEIANYNQFKEQSKQKMEATNTGNLQGNMAQQQTLYEAAEQTNAAAEAAERRASAAKMAAMGFMGAGAIALVMSIYDCYQNWAKGGCVRPYACEKGLMTQNKSIEEYYLKSDEQRQIIAETDYKEFETYLDSSENNLDYLIRNMELRRLTKGAKASMPNDLAQKIEFLYPEAKEETTFVSAFKLIGYNIAELLIPRANAGGKSLIALGIGAFGAGMIIFEKILIGTKLKAFMQNGFVRSAGHFAFASVAGLVAKDAGNEAQKLRGRANQYKELAAKLGVVSTDTGNHNNLDSNYELGAIEATNIGGANALDKNSTCFTGSKGNLNEDRGCACKKGKKCKRPELPKLNSMSTVSIPNAVKTSSDLLGSAGTGIFNGDLEGGLANANAAGKNAARLKKVSLGIKKKFNDKITGQGGKPIDFNKLENSTRSKLIKAAVADIKNLNAGARAALGKRFPGVFGDGQEVDKKPEIKLGDTKVKTGGGLGSLKGSKGSKKKDAMAGFTFDMEEGEDVAVAEAQEGVSLTLDSSSDQVETERDDIAGDRNKNIFSLITKRYFKTAYPRFFEEAK